MNKQWKCCHDNKGMASHTAQEDVCLLAMTENQNQIVSLKDVYIYMYNVESETTTNVLSKTKSTTEMFLYASKRQKVFNVV